MSKSIYFTAILILFTFCGIWGQSTDLLRLEYTTLPNEDSGINTSRYRFLLNMPFKLKGGQYLIVGSEYNYIDFDTTKEFPFDDRELEHLHVIDLNVGYIFKWNENWRFVGIVTPRLASNLVTNLVGRDFLLNLTATLWKEVSDGDRPFRLVLGLTYNSTTGLPVPLPLVNYYRRFDPKWSFTLGIPRSDFRYHISDRNTMLMALFLDGYFVNAQNDIILPDNDLGSAISLSALISAIGYQHNISKMASFYAFAGYTLFQNGLLRDDKRNNVFNLNNDGGLYLKAGFKISIF